MQGGNNCSTPQTPTIKTKKENEMRSYNIKLNGKVIRTVGGKKAGRFATNATTKPRKRTTKRHNRKQRHILTPLIPILWILLIATGCTGICELNEMSRQPLTAEPMKVEVVEASGSFESHDIPADYVEPDLFDRYFGDKADEARKVATCESGNRDIESKPNWNGTKDYGRFQVNSLWLDVYGLTPAQLLDAETNLSTAKKIYDRTGNWTAWKYSKHCHGLN